MLKQIKDGESWNNLRQRMAQFFINVMLSLNIR